MRPDLSFLGKAGFHQDTSPAPLSQLWSPYAAGLGDRAPIVHDARSPNRWLR